MRRASATAPGKLILLGEHAVVYGMPALAVPVSERRSRADVEIDPSGVTRIEAIDTGDVWPPDGIEPSPLNPLADLTQAALSRFGEERLGLTARLSSTIPIAAGMGSSASISVALARAIAEALEIAPDISDIIDLAMVGERGYHGNPSGIDVEVTARETPILHTRGGKAVPIVDIGDDFHLLAANTGRRPVGTGVVVSEVAEARDRDRKRYDGIFGELGELAKRGAETLERGSSAQLGGLMNRAQELLAGIGVSSPAIDRIIEAAMEAGAAGAKLSGAGRGGHVVIALRSTDDEQAVRDAVIDAGAIDICGFRIGKFKLERAS